MARRDGLKSVPRLRFLLGKNRLQSQSRHVAIAPDSWKGTRKTDPRAVLLIRPSRFSREQTTGRNKQTPRADRARNLPEHGGSARSIQRPHARAERQRTQPGRPRSPADRFCGDSAGASCQRFAARSSVPSGFSSENPMLSDSSPSAFEGDDADADKIDLVEPAPPFRDPETVLGTPPGVAPAVHQAKWGFDPHSRPE